jgi:(E)-4-hydroxy-3-methylbut-2-enyl-diphosphate synthase
MYTRADTREVSIGNIVLGKGSPVRVQSMTNTDTADFDVTWKQIKALENAGCELVRVAFLNRRACDSLKHLKEVMSVPLIADIHFSADLALMALDCGADKVRVNPGNLGGLDQFKKVIEKAKNLGRAIRIGVNSGSVEPEILEKYGYPSDDALVESALRYVEFAEQQGFYNTVVSIKSTDLKTLISSCKKFAIHCNVPQHVGVTEAGMGEYAIIKSSAGLGSLLLDGIGDTLRVSLTGDPVDEVGVGFDILKATGVRRTGPEIISCPTCGRIQIDLESLVKKVSDAVSHIKEPVKITVLGCPVNGPGEAREADIGIAGGKGRGWIYLDGKVVSEVPEEHLMKEFLKVLQGYIDKK